MPKCLSCSYDIRENMTFCPSCGSRLKWPEQSKGGPGAEQTVEVTNNPSKSQIIDADTAAGDAEKKRRTVLIWTVAGVVLAAIVGASIWSEQLSQEEATAAATAEAISGACAQFLKPNEPSITEGVITSHNEVVKRMDIRIENSAGERIGTDATCDYSFNTDKTEFFIDSIEWRRQIDGVPSDINYSRTTNLITVTTDEPEERESPTPTSPSQSCSDAFRAAASVPLSQDNNAEIRETIFACSNVDEWWRTLQRYPDTFGMTYYLESEKGLYVRTACTLGERSPVCKDADRLGLTF
jgi:hypothetical protein